MIAVEAIDLRSLHSLFLSEQDFTFVVGNPASNGESVIYITTDPELGKLDLTISNNSASAIEIAPTSLVQIFAHPPLTAVDATRIKVATTGWNLTPGDDCLELRCSSPVTIPPRDKRKIRFIDVMSSGDATTGFLLFDYSGFKTIDDDSRRATVFVQHPPKAGPAPLTFDTGARPEYAGQQGRTVYVTPWQITTTKAGISNHIVLQAGNSRGDTPISSAPSSDAKIVVSFTSGSSTLSLCSDEQIKVAAARIVQGTQWRIERDNAGPVPVWILRPPTGAANIFAGGEIIGVRFDSIVSRLAANFASPMFIQFANIPGYNDGYAAFFLQKVPPVPFFRSFGAVAGSRKLENDAVLRYKEKVTLTWDVFAAESCRILELDKDLAPAQSYDVYPAASKVTYTVSPRLAGEPYQDLKKAIQLAVGPPAAQLSATFTNRQDSGAPRVDAKFQWNCSNGSHCTLRGKDAVWDNQPIAGSLNTEVSSDQTFTITCEGAGSASASVEVGVPAVEARLRVDCRAGYLNATVSWETKWAGSVSVSEPGYGEISNHVRGVYTDPWDLPRHPPVNETDPNPFNPRWTRHFQIVVKRKNTVIKDVIVTSLQPVAEA